MSRTKIHSGLLSEAGRDRVALKLADLGYSSREAAAIIEHVRGLDFVPLLALASCGKPGNKHLLAGGDLVSKAAPLVAADAEVAALKLDENRCENALNALFRGKTSSLPAALRSDPSQALLLRKVAEVFAKKSRLRLRAGEAQKAAELLNKGIATKDLAGVTSDTALILKKLPSSIVKTLRSPPQGFLGFSTKFLKDLLEAPADLLSNAGSSKPRKLLDNTLAQLYTTLPAAGLIRTWTLEITEYRSIQLAIILFTRYHGLAIDRKDLDAARASLNEDDLSPALARALDRFHSDGDFPDDLSKILRQFFPLK